MLRTQTPGRHQQKTNSMTWEQLKGYLKGKCFIIGLTFVDKSGEVIDQYQTHGLVIELTDSGLLKFIRDDKTIFQMPYDKESIEKANKNAQYREVISGKIINSPDFIMQWEIVSKPNDNLDDIKENGYVPVV
ncbi:MAG: hypothetical protein ACI9JN_002631 [Bacteroidia bacterium]